jgi:hypothetical protein
MGDALKAGASIWSANQAKKQASAQRKDIQRAQKTLGVEYADYVENVRELEEQFDPWDVSQAIDSVYAAVVTPLIRDFEEVQMPSLRASFSASPAGTVAGSGTAKWAEAEARRGLFTEVAGVRERERLSAVDRNYQDQARKLEVETNIFSGALGKAGQNVNFLQAAGLARRDYSSAAAMQAQGVAALGEEGLKAASMFAGGFGGGGGMMGGLSSLKGMFTGA